MRIVLSAILFAFVVALSGPVVAAEKIGVIIMHGKWGTGLPNSPVGILAAALSKEGIIALTPDMPWSKTRLYAKDYEETMAEIDKAVVTLKSKGATKIVVGGHSIGANTAIGYGARRDGLAAILAIAPGHLPEGSDWKGKFAADVAKARKAVNAGDGEKKDKFQDINQGKKKTLNIPARIYLSWFAPDGPSIMPVNAANLKPGTPLLWLTGDKDGLHKREGKSYAFDKVPAHAKNAYIVVSSGHGDAPKKGVKEIIKWLKSL